MPDTLYNADTTHLKTASVQHWSNHVYRGKNPIYATTTGSANAQILTIPTFTANAESTGLSLITSLSGGDEFTFKAGYSNTGALTLQIIGGTTLTAYAVRCGSAALSGGEWQAGDVITVRYEAATTSFQMLDTGRFKAAGAEATARTRQGRSREQVSITDYWNGDPTDYADNAAALGYAMKYVKAYGDVEVPAFDDAAADTGNGTVTPYLLDAETTITRPLVIQGTGGWLKLRDNSTLFSGAANLALPARYLFKIQCSNARIKGLNIDGNSANNKYLTHYYTSGVNNNRCVGLINIGFVNSADVADLTDIEVSGCHLKGSSWTSIDSAMSTYYIRRLSVFNNIIENGQNVQIAPSSVIGGIIHGNHLFNAYFAHFQWYYMCSEVLFTKNDVRFSTNEINTALVDPDLLSGSALTHGGVAELGKLAALTNKNCHYRSNTLRGTGVNLTSGSEQCAVDDNDITDSEIFGITVRTSGRGNSITRNRVYRSSAPGMYADVTSYEVLHSNNEYHECCNKVFNGGLYPVVTGYDFNAQVVIAPGHKGYFDENKAYREFGDPTFGMLFYNAVSRNGYRGRNNDFGAAGITRVAVNTSLVFPPSPVTAIDTKLDVNTESILEHTVTLTAVNVKALLGTPISLVPAPGLVPKPDTLLFSSQSITSMTNANPGVFTKNAHGYSNDQWVWLYSLDGPELLDRQFFQVDNATANTFTLKAVGGSAVNTTDTAVYPVFLSGNVAAAESGKAVVFESAQFFLDYATTGYVVAGAGASNLEIRYTSGAGQLVATVASTGFMDQTADKYRTVREVTTAAITPVMNAALVLCVPTTDMTTGDSPLVVKIRYRIVDVAF